MKSVLFVARIDPEAPARHDWANFSQDLKEQITQDKNALRLAENVWLLNLEKSLSPLGWLISLAEKNSISYGLLPFEKEPIWLPAGFYPGTTPDQTPSSS
jgi:hypothetical protein